MNLTSLSNSEFISAFKQKVQNERKATCEVIEFVKEAYRRKIHHETEHESLFEFMTKTLGYSGGSAQRRIDAAKILFEIPELNESIQDGSLNLTQVAILARSVREKEASSDKTVLIEQKREILDAIKNQNATSTEQTICTILDIEPKAHETKRTQQDGSVRAQITFNKEQIALYEEIKSLISHTNPNASIADVFEIVAKEYLKRRTNPPKRKNSPPKRKNNPRKKESTATVAVKRVSSNENLPTRHLGAKPNDLHTHPPETKHTHHPEMKHTRHPEAKHTRHPEAKPKDLDDYPPVFRSRDPSALPQDDGKTAQEDEKIPQDDGKMGQNGKKMHAKASRYVPKAIEREIRAEQKCCRWRYKSGKICGSKFQLQTDHIKSIWAGGTSEKENLQLLCAVHNRLKYETESDFVI